tara:strand:- start:4989 stop:7184 length:2196 start_codon:yes stop_codon:yes gene_type:complete
MSDERSSEELNEQQSKAVNCSLGNKLILAGAGSGKTKVLIHRVVVLIRDFNIKPSNILALTFTNKASNEMKQRLENILRTTSQGLWFGTFHGICRRILKIHWREAGIRDFFTILDSQDQLRMIKRIIKQKNLDENIYDPKHLQSFINRQKDKGSRHDNCDNDDTKYIEIYRDYDLACRQTNSVDFADLILLTYEMFKSNPSILNYYSNRFKNIMVDEFQDTNTLQFELLKVINGTNGSLYAVGDDDQAIYGWRGARSKNIKYFTDQFSGVEIFKLEQNYRSTNSILSVANKLIENNTGRLGKNLWSDSASGDPVFVYEAFNDDDECGFITEKIRELVTKGYKRSDIAILYRSNYLSRRIEEELNSKSIPYKIFGGFRFFERAEVKDVLAYLRVSVNTSDDSSFERTINNPPRGLGEKTMRVIREQSKISQKSMWDCVNDRSFILTIGARASSSIQSYLSIIRNLQNIIKDANLRSIISDIISLSGLNNYYETKKTDESLSKQENLEELVSTAERFSANNTDSENIIQDFLDNASLEAGEYQSKINEDPVQLMTIHMSKGLEFPVVFLTGLEEGIFPNENRNITPGFMEEERRLCYVAITRAMKKLFLSYANSRYIHGSSSFFIPSRFLDEIPESMLQSVKNKSKTAYPYKKNTFDNDHNQGMDQDIFSDKFSIDQSVPFVRVGQRVNHMRFGQGVILSYTGKNEDLKLQINFENYGKKWLVLSYAQLEFLN